MASPEKSSETALRFINSWRINPSRLVPELLSLSNETNEKQDVYSFEITQNGLIDSQTTIPVREFILQNTPVQKAEYKAFNSLENWAILSSEGIALWISPPSTEYPRAKAIFSRIVYDSNGNKHLVNSAILFGNEKTDCIDIVPSSNKKQGQDIRSRIFYLDEDDDNILSQIISNIEVYTRIKLNKYTFRNIDQARMYAEMVENGIEADIIVQNMQRSGFLGIHPISCPVISSASNILLFNSRVMNLTDYEFKPGVCRVCRHHTHVGPCSICKECEKKFN